MRPLPLAAFLLLAVPWAQAQTRVGPVETGGLNTGSQSGSLTSTLPGGGVAAYNSTEKVLFLPVLDGAPASKRSLWNRLFKAEPETAASSAARRRVETLRPLVVALAQELGPFLASLKGAEPDLGEARASARRMVRLEDQADKRFAAAP